MDESPAPIRFPDDIGPGARLRQAREAANRSVREISVALHLDQKTVEALEADSFDRLPAPTFVRGYMRGYARELGLPPEPILKAYDLQGFEPPALTPDITEAPQTHASDLVFRLVTYAVGAGLLLLVVLWWQSQDFEGIGIDGISGIGGDLIGWSSESPSEPPLPATETPMTAAAPEGGDESTVTAGEPPELPRDTGLASGLEPPSPPSAEGMESGGIVVATGPVPDEEAGAFGASAEREAPATPAALPAGAAVATGPSPDEDAGASGASAEREAPATPAALPADAAATGPPPDEGAGASGVTAEREAPATPAALPADTAAATGPSPDEDASASGATTEREAPATPVALPADAAVTTEPAPDEDAGASGATVERDAPATPAALPADTAATESPPDEDAGASEAGADSEVSVSAAGEPATPASPDTREAVSSQTPSDTSDAAAAPPSITETAESELVLDFTHESWLEVYDSDRARLFFGLVEPGRILNLTGAPPFDVLIGYARDVRVTLDGAPFDYAPHTRHGVARFSLGPPPGATPAP